MGSEMIFVYQDNCI